MNIQFKGNCTVDRAVALRSDLLRALDQGEPRLSFANVAEADLSFFQLIHSLKRSCERKGVELTLESDLPAHLRKAAAWSGLPELANAAERSAPVASESSG